MANPGRTRPASLGPIDPDEPPIPQIFPKLQIEGDRLRALAGDERDVDYHAAIWAIIEDARDFNENYLAPAREYAAALYEGQLPDRRGRGSLLDRAVRGP